MSSNRLKYDECVFKIDNVVNENQLDYNIFKPKYVVDKTCPLSKLPIYLSPEDRTNVESELYGLHRVASTCPSNKYNPATNTFSPILYSPARVCEGIYYMTPSGLDYISK